jgi:hypothetical protein
MLKYSFVLLTATTLFFTACGGGSGDCCSDEEGIGESGAVAKSAPTAVIVSERSECTVGETLSFNGLDKSNDKDGTVKDYTWSIAGSEVSTNPNPSLTCLKLGVQNVCLTVTDDDNLTSTQTCKSITVKQRPNIKPLAKITGVADTCTIGDTIDAVGTTSSDADGEVISYAWSENAFTCDTLGEKQICLIVTDNEGEKSDQNCTTITVLDVPNIRPIAQFTPETLLCTEDENITLDATTSSDSDGTVAQYTWNKEILTGATPTLPCTTAGTDKICLSVTDDDNLTSREVCKDLIIARKENIKPTAVITNVAETCEIGTNIYPAYSESTDIDGNITTIQWVVNDITILGQNKPTLACTKGDQNICLTVQDNDGAISDTVCTTIKGEEPIVIQPQTVPPVSIITIGEYDGDGFYFDCSQSHDGDTIDSDLTPQNDKGPITSIWSVTKYWKSGYVEGPHGGNVCQKWIGADAGLDYMDVSLTVTDDDGEETTTIKQYTFDNGNLVEK